MTRIRKSEIEHIRQAVAHFGGVRALAATVGIPAGTLSSAQNGKRRLNASHRRKLISVGLLPAPRKAVPWKTVAVEMAKEHGGLHFMLLWAGVDPERARAIVEKEGVL